MVSSIAIAGALERGTYDGAVADVLAQLWALTFGRSVVRRLRWRGRARVLAVGGATLGGSGKTPLAIACAAELAAAGVSVALVGHAFRARPSRARIVGAGDTVDAVGDEALLAARALSGCGARVVVAPTRAQAVAFAAGIADVLVLDGVAQTAPVPAALALLAVDAAEPWGRRAAVPPKGDLRAPLPTLMRACDLVVPIVDELAATKLEAWSPGEGAQTRSSAQTRSAGAWHGGVLLTWRELARMRVGLACALARPERVLRSLRLRGVTPETVVCARDHGPFGAGELARMRAWPDANADAKARPLLWLASPKCALHLPCALPVATLDHTVLLADDLKRELRVRLDPRGAAP